MIADDDLGDFWLRARAEAHRRGSLFAALSVSVWEGFWRWRRGELHEALACLALGLEQDRMWGGTGIGESYTRAFEIGCHLDRGDLATARRVADAALTGPALGEGGRLMKEAIASLLVAERRFEEALATLDGAATPVPIPNPAWNPWRRITARRPARPRPHRRGGGSWSRRRSRCCADGARRATSVGPAPARLARADRTASRTCGRPSRCWRRRRPAWSSRAPRCTLGAARGVHRRRGGAAAAGRGGERPPPRRPGDRAAGLRRPPGPRAARPTCRRTAAGRCRAPSSGCSTSRPRASASARSPSSCS